MNNEEKKVTLEDNIAEVEEARNEEVIEETAVVESVEEINNIEDFTEEKEVSEEQEESEEKMAKVKKKRSPIVELLLTGIVDQLVIMSSSVILLFITNLLLNLIGFKFKADAFVTMLLIMYAIVNVVYPSVCKICKFEGTVGSKIINNK